MSSIFSVFIRAFTWLTKNFVDHAVSAAHVSVVITEAVKAILSSPAVGILENIADAITGTQIPTQLANLINGIIPKILAVELSIQGLPANPTAADILAFEQAILASFSIQNNNSKLYTEIAAQAYGVIQATIASGKTNFADWVIAIEEIYAQYKLDIANNTSGTVPNVVVNA